MTAVASTSIGGYRTPRSSGAAILQATGGGGTTAVTLNAKSGIITLNAGAAITTAAVTDVSFTLTNAHIRANSIILVSLVYPVAGAGSPVVTVSSVAAGSCVIAVSNYHASAALDQVTKVCFSVIQ